jgi:hypothetical protein
VTDLDATDADATDLDAFVAEHRDRYAETQGVPPERVAEFGETYRSRGT